MITHYSVTSPLDYTNVLLQVVLASHLYRLHVAHNLVAGACVTVTLCSFSDNSPSQDKLTGLWQEANLA